VLLKAQPAGFAIAQSQLWPDLYSSQELNTAEKKKALLFCMGFYQSLQQSPTHYFMYLCIRVHLLIVSSIRRLCTNTRAQAVTFEASLHQDTIKTPIM